MRMLTRLEMIGIITLGSVFVFGFLIGMMI